MKIIVMNSADVRIEVLTVSDRLIENDDIEQFLSEHGYSLNNISWMAAPVDFVPVKFHDYGFCATDGEEIHAERDARLKDFTIYDSVQEVKRREQQELVEKLHRYGSMKRTTLNGTLKENAPSLQPTTMRSLAMS